MRKAAQVPDQSDQASKLSPIKHHKTRKKHGLRIHAEELQEGVGHGSMVSGGHANGIWP
jgi:hypothetical protein